VQQYQLPELANEVDLVDEPEDEVATADLAVEVRDQNIAAQE